MSQGSITLTSGMRKNLFSLQSTNTLLERTQKRMATGLRVQTAVDDPVNYFTALGHRQRAEDLGARKDEMSESIQLVMSANEGVTAITSLIASAKSLAQSALSAGTEDEATTLQTQYNEVLSQINLLVNDSGYKGVNLLGGTTVQHEVKFNENGSSLLTMTGFDATTTGLSITNAGDSYTADVAAVQAKLELGDTLTNDWMRFTAITAGVDGNNIGVTFNQLTADDSSNPATAATVNSATAITINLGAIWDTVPDTDVTKPNATLSDVVTAVTAAINLWNATHAENQVQFTFEAGSGAGIVAATGTTPTPAIAVTEGSATSLTGGTALLENQTIAGQDWWHGGAVNKDRINVSISQLDQARTTLRSESQTLSTNLSTITIRQEFTDGMINTLEDGAAGLTNADMNQEGANMLMLQTRQSLGTTSLSLASQAAQSVLRLF
jgi:flagellin